MPIDREKADNKPPQHVSDPGIEPQSEADVKLPHIGADNKSTDLKSFSNVVFAKKNLVSISFFL